MPALKNPRHEAFAQTLARGMSAAAAYGQVGFNPHRANAATLARKKHISARVAELQEEQLAIHQQATAAAAARRDMAR
jgi:phage terminase small subunit